MGVTHWVKWCVIGALQLLLAGQGMAQPGVAGQIYYSGHTNSVHDAASDLKQFGLYLGYRLASGEGVRLLLEGAALTPPNGAGNPIPGMRVRGRPSNQHDTYLYSIGLGKQFFYGDSAMWSADVRIGMINGHAETLIRNAIYRLHTSAGMTNLRDSPASSDRRSLLEMTLGNANVLYRPYQYMAIQSGQALTLGTLENSLAGGLYLTAGGQDGRAWMAGLRPVSWMPAGTAWYAGYYGKWFARDLVTRHAGTRQYVPYLQTGLQATWLPLVLSVKFTHYLGPLVDQQFEATSNYMEFGLGVAF